MTTPEIRYSVVAELAKTVGPVPKVGTGREAGWSIDQVRACVIPAVTAAGCSLRPEIIDHTVTVDNGIEHVVVVVRVWLREPDTEIVLGEGIGTSAAKAQSSHAAAIAYSSAWRDAIMSGLSISLDQPATPSGRAAPSKSPKLQLVEYIGGNLKLAAHLWNEHNGDLDAAKAHWDGLPDGRKR